MGKTTTQNTSSTPDRQTQDWTKKIYQNAQDAANQGPGPINPLSIGAGDYSQTAMNAGKTGLAAAGGDPAAMAGLMNPYQSQVMDQMNQGWQHINAQTQQGVNAGATAAGAFGGARHGIAAGTAQSQNDQAQAAQQAQLLQQGYTQAQGQANTLAGFGMQGSQLGSQQGQYMQQQEEMRRNPALYRMGILQQGLNGTPYGTSGQTSSHDPAGGLKTAIGVGSMFL